MGGFKYVTCFNCVPPSTLVCKTPRGAQDIGLMNVHTGGHKLEPGLSEQILMAGTQI